MNFKSRFSNTCVRGLLTIITVVLSVGQPAAQQATMNADTKAALDRISADSLRGHLSFIASDLLEGRNTPSPGLDIAAEYIAAQFRRAGLEPAGDDGYFQIANWFVTDRDSSGFDCRIEASGRTIPIAYEQISVSSDGGAGLTNAQLLKVDYKDTAALAALTADQVRDHVVITEVPDIRQADRASRAEMQRVQSQFVTRMAELKAALIISVDRANPTGVVAKRLIDPENRRPPNAAAGALLITMHGAKIVELYDGMKPGSSNTTISLKLPVAIEKPVKLRNVVAVLRGSDPALKDTYVLVTGHYDHLGVRPGTTGDNIYNGANDDGSGTVSVVELASALSTLKERPKRSIVFMTVFGEEKGLLGSRYYGRHPIFPIAKTIADVNLEQVGRTDSTEGPQIANASLTGFDYTDIGPILQAAGQATGIKVYKHEANSDAYFGRSDNQALADQGVPAHTLCVAFNYSDYHGVGDHWEKVDYDNMAKVDRMVGLALIMIANNPVEPKWNENNAKTARYVKAWQEHHAK